MLVYSGGVTRWIESDEGDESWTHDAMGGFLKAQGSNDSGEASAA